MRLLHIKIYKVEFRDHSINFEVKIGDDPQTVTYKNLSMASYIMEGEINKFKTTDEPTNIFFDCSPPIDIEYNYQLELKKYSPLNEEEKREFFKHLTRDLP